MDKHLAKYADYSQITDVNTSNEGAAAGPSSGEPSTSNIGRPTPSGSEGHPYSVESFPLFRLHQQQPNPPTRGDWQYTSPEKVCAARADIDDNMLTEFAGYAYPPPWPGAVVPAAPTLTQSQWIANLLVECARAIAVSDSSRVKNLMWVLNEMSSPYGDSDQRLSACFLQAMFCRITGTGVNCHRTLTAAAEKSYSFDTIRKMILDYQVRIDEHN